MYVHLPAVTNYVTLDTRIRAGTRAHSLYRGYLVPLCRHVLHIVQSFKHVLHCSFVFVFVFIFSF
jgi:hypothetical protein